MSASVGWGVAASSAAALMSCPAWQYPHWGTSSAIQARWRAWSFPPTEPLDGGDLLVAHPGHGGPARAHGGAVQVDGAGAA